MLKQRKISKKERKKYVEALMAIRKHISPEEYIEAMDAYLLGRIDIKDIFIRFHIKNYERLKEDAERKTAG